MASPLKTDAAAARLVRVVRLRVVAAREGERLLALDAKRPRGVALPHAKILEPDFSGHAPCFPQRLNRAPRTAI
jgi:hypothetical protein